MTCRRPSESKTKRNTNRGAILLELVVSLAILVMASLAISAALRDGLMSLQRSSDEALAGDMARTIVALVEAGVARPEQFDGPMPAWEADGERWDGDPLVDALELPQADASSVVDGWFVSAETEPTSFAGLTKLTVTVERLGETEQPVASRTLVQFVRLRDDLEDTIGGEGELSELASDAQAQAQRESRRSGRDSGRGGQQ